MVCHSVDRHLTKRCSLVTGKIDNGDFPFNNNSSLWHSDNSAKGCSKDAHLTFSHSDRYSTDVVAHLNFSFESYPRLNLTKYSKCVGNQRHYFFNLRYTDVWRSDNF